LAQRVAARRTSAAEQAGSLAGGVRATSSTGPREPRHAAYGILRPTCPAVTHPQGAAAGDTQSSNYYSKAGGGVARATVKASPGDRIHTESQTEAAAVPRRPPQAMKHELVSTLDSDQ